MFGDVGAWKCFLGTFSTENILLCLWERNTKGESGFVFGVVNEGNI